MQNILCDIMNSGEFPTRSVHISSVPDAVAKFSINFIPHFPKAHRVRYYKHQHHRHFKVSKVSLFGSDIDDAVLHLCCPFFARLLAIFQSSHSLNSVFRSRNMLYSEENILNISQISREMLELQDEKNNFPNDYTRNEIRLPFYVVLLSQCIAAVQNVSYRIVRLYVMMI